MPNNRTLVRKYYTFYNLINKLEHRVFVSLKVTELFNLQVVDLCKIKFAKYLLRQNRICHVDIFIF